MWKYKKTKCAAVVFTIVLTVLEMFDKDNKINSQKIKNNFIDHQCKRSYLKITNKHVLVTV